MIFCDNDGVYHGNGKPNDSHTFLRDFVDEVTVLSEGVTVNETLVPVTVSCAICDAPAKSFLLNVMGHNAALGCTKCQTNGKMFGRRMAYTSMQDPLRTDESFRNKDQAAFHKGDSILTEIPHFGPVSNCVLDYMHLVLLGTLRKIMYMWIGGPLKVRLSAATIERISQKLVSVSAWTPLEFARRPRSLKFVKRFKATELRLILFYVGIAVFKTELREEIYQHFLVLHATMYMLARSSCSENLADIQELLLFWVQSFKRLYGKEYVSHNIHGLLHVTSDVEKYGPLDAYSAFKFENFLQILKKMIRKGEKPLQQLVRRFMEAEQSGLLNGKLWEHENISEPLFKQCHSSGPLKSGTTSPQYFVCQFPKGFTISTKSEANNCCKLRDNSIILVNNFAFDSTKKTKVAIGRKFRNLEEAYSYPFESSSIGIHLAHTLERNLKTWPVNDIDSKCFRMPFKHGYLIVPLMHSTRYCLVDFEEGPQIIPETWLADDGKTCSWPSWGDDLLTSQSTWDKAIRFNPPSPQSDWGEASIRRIRVRGSNFPYVRTKLKEAEASSETDLDSNKENENRRRLRKKRTQELDSSDDEPLLPKLLKPGMCFLTKKFAYDASVKRSQNNSDHFSSNSSQGNARTPKSSPSLSSERSPMAALSVEVPPKFKEGKSIHGQSPPESPTRSPINTQEMFLAGSVEQASSSVNTISKGKNKPMQDQSPESPTSSPSNTQKMFRAGSVEKPSTSFKTNSKGQNKSMHGRSHSKTLPLRNIQQSLATESVTVPSQNNKSMHGQPNSSSSSTENMKERSMALARSMTELEYRAYVISCLCNLKLKINQLSASSVPTGSSNFDNSNNDACDEVLFGLPADSIQEWEAVERKIENDKSYSPKLVKELKRFSDDTVSGTVRRILSRMLSNKVASEFSLCGFNTSKRAFNKTAFFTKVLPATVKAVHPLFTTKEVTKSCENWLRLATQRSGGKKFGHYKKKSSLSDASSNQTSRNVSRELFTGDRDEDADDFDSV
ncbi:Deoxyguanosinetriphosphate triphosphohydrolase-like protein [Frankliniella fusca]|uniref:Deoxyguanosinetriphosphate triphosphohydrolase-like protein n=1 Tax=Frankliniella fusca TaxID=407009 RepID=A0AAE1HZP0_9NEOP|nr:Deoxyguanosinetriphosphate triphosphohydrolase-like protein [Frankliniella fusca]